MSLAIIAFAVYICISFLVGLGWIGEFNRIKHLILELEKRDKNIKDANTSDAEFWRRSNEKKLEVADAEMVALLSHWWWVPLWLPALLWYRVFFLPVKMWREIKSRVSIIVQVKERHAERSRRTLRVERGRG